jgi:uncharacterized protein
MRYNVAGLLKSPIGATRLITVDEPFDLEDPEVRLVAPVRGSLRLIRDLAGIWVEGQLDTRAQVTCARCLEPAEVEVDIDLSEHFRPTVAIADGPPIQVDPDEEDEPATEIDAHHMLALGPVVWQNIMLALPQHALCRRDCAGLCPVCGQNRNAGSCACRPEPDPRWAALAELRLALEDQS